MNKRAYEDYEFIDSYDDDDSFKKQKVDTYSKGLPSYSYSSDPHICLWCEEEFTREEDLETHYEESRACRPYVCQCCGRTFSSVESLRSHRDFHPEYPTTSLVCLECDLPFQTTGHYQTTSLSETPYNMAISMMDRGLCFCSPCRLMKIRKEGKNSNTYSVRAVTAATSRSALHRLTCPFCDSKFLNLSTLMDHCSDHKEYFLYGYPCDACASNCSSLKALEEHLSTHNKGKVYLCDVCGVKMKDAFKRDSHREGHSRSTNFSELLDVKKNTKYVASQPVPARRSTEYFADMINNVLKKRSIILCDKCNFATKDPVELEEHEKTHDSESLSWSQSRDLNKNEESSNKGFERARGHPQMQSHTHQQEYSQGNSQGHQQGYSQGHQQEYSQGHPQGHQQEYSQGHQQGNSQAHSHGRSQGHQQEYSQGHPQEYSQGHQQEYSQGHSQGHQQGNSQAHSHGRSQGHPQGHQQEYSLGHPQRHSQGHQQEYSQGHQQGYSQGRSQELKQRYSNPFSRKRSPSLEDQTFVPRQPVITTEESSTSLDRPVNPQDNVMISNDMNDLYQCPFCRKPNESLFELISHCRVHPQYIFYKMSCPDCGLESETVQDLSIHVSRHMNRSVFLCPICGEKLFSSVVYNFHIKMHEEKNDFRKHLSKITNFLFREKMMSSVFRCDRCDVPHECEAALREHILRRHSFSCQFCYKGYNNPDSLIRHLTNAHEEYMFYKNKCGVCDILCGSYQMLEKHICDHLFAKKIYLCGICGATFHVEKLRRLHIESHRGETISVSKVRLRDPEIPTQNEGNIMCQKCGALFDNKRQYAIHAKDRHRSPFICQYCNEVFATSAALSAHCHQHDEYPLRGFRCSLCNGRFLSLVTLEDHVSSVHEDGPVFLCCLCGEKFNDKNVRMKHELGHKTKDYEEDEGGSQMSDLRVDFPCRECNARFTSEMALKKHVDNDHIPFGCNKCRARFRSNEERLRHLTTVHVPKRGAKKQDIPKTGTPLARYNCSFCSKSFGSKEGKEYHEKSHANAS